MAICSSNVVRGVQKSCGCLKTAREQSTSHRRIGERFGRFVIVARAGRSHVLVRCDCGKERTVQLGNITSGRQQSCGCYAREARRARDQRMRLAAMQNLEVHGAGVLPDRMIARSTGRPLQWVQRRRSSFGIAEVKEDLPYGYSRTDDGTIVVDAPAVAVFERASRMRLAGHSYAEIAKANAAVGAGPKTKPGVKKMLFRYAPRVPVGPVPAFTRTCPCGAIFTVPRPQMVERYCSPECHASRDRVGIADKGIGRCLIAIRMLNRALRQARHRTGRNRNG